jgi:hypothetical protein
MIYSYGESALASWLAIPFKDSVGLLAHKNN